MKKVLFVASITRHILAFHIPYLKWFKEHGYEVHVVSKGNESIKYCDKHYNLPFERHPLKIKNIQTYKQLKKIIDEEKYDIIHCHTPTASVLTRLASKKSRKKNNTKVIYTAHGFHFYKGAPVFNWLIYYPIEKIMSHYTDCLITITNEDYEFAKRHLKTNRIEHINGVGMNTERFRTICEQKVREIKSEFNIKQQDIIFTYVAELNENKNQILLIETIDKLKQKFSNVKLLLVGDGNYKEKYQKEIINRNLQQEILLLGRRDDIAEILSITEIYLASSIREGLPVNVMEAMYMKLPIIATNNRGHRELVQNDVNGYILNNNVTEFVEKIEEIIKDDNRIKILKHNSYEKSLDYQIDKVIEAMEKIYEKEED